MKCPHCLVGIRFESDEETLRVKNGSFKGRMQVFGINIGLCPECDKVIVLALQGDGKRLSEYGNVGFIDEDKASVEILYPKYTLRLVNPEVPEKRRADYQEACAVLSLSPKASAALSRRILQEVLRDKYNITGSDLGQEIQNFVKSEEVPSYLSQAIDAIRNIGNFAAHPLKSTSTGEIVDVEPGEAEWLLDVLEMLFDFAYVQPARLQENQSKLNAKLAALGKPPMKTSDA